MDNIWLDRPANSLVLIFKDESLTEFIGKTPYRWLEEPQVGHMFNLWMIIRGSTQDKINNWHTNQKYIYPKSECHSRLMEALPLMQKVNPRLVVADCDQENLMTKHGGNLINCYIHKIDRFKLPLN